MSEGLIIVVEDERNFSRFLKMSLEDKGYEVFSYENGKDGEEAIKNMCPDLVVLDVMLPGKTGLDICEELKRKEKYRDIPILRSSALQESMAPISLEISSREKAVSYLPKLEIQNRPSSSCPTATAWPSPRPRGK
ncbi:MAG: response regulator [Kiritimatiellia bacterium]